MADGAKPAAAANEPFLTDVKTLRERARANINDGAVTSTYKGDPKKTVEILQAVLATEIVCVLRYTHAFRGRERHLQRGREGPSSPNTPGKSRNT